MLSTIPFDPSVTLGNIVDPAKLAQLELISEKEAPIGAAEDKMNSLITFKRSIDNTIQELGSMHVDVETLEQKSLEIAKDIQKAALDYANIKLAAKLDILDIRGQTVVSANWESPLDFNRTEIKKMPLSADSMNMNVQYFSREESSQNSQTQSECIQEFVSSEFKFLGTDFSDQAAKAAASQVNSQYSRHNIAGTLVIAVSCTHKDAALLAPCVIDVDKAIRVWNSMYKDDMIKTDSPMSIMQIAANAQTENEKVMTIVSGATYGSSFVGMVHILNNTHTASSERIRNIAASIQSQVTAKKWFADISGGFGLNEQFANDMKSLLSTQDIMSHCTITTRGSIPSIKSNQVKLAVHQFAEFDGKAAMENVAALQNATASAKDSIDESAEKARLGQQMVALKNAQIQGVLTGLSEIDSGSNQILDINSLMTAFEDYVDKALAGELGVPINYYLKPIPKSQLAQMWVDKYFPDKFLKVQTPEGE